jgi:hypothetical protein
MEGVCKYPEKNESNNVKNFIKNNIIKGKIGIS